MFRAFPVMQVFDGRDFFVSFSVPPLSFIESYLAEHRINLIYSCDRMITQYG